MPSRLPAPGAVPWQQAQGSATPFDRGRRTQ